MSYVVSLTVIVETAEQLGRLTELLTRTASGLAMDNMVVQLSLAPEPTEDETTSQEPVT